MSDTTSFDTRAAEFKVAKASLKSNEAKTRLIADIPSAMKQLRALRQGTNDRPPVDITLGQYMHDKFGYAPDDKGCPESFYAALGINPNKDTIHSLMSTPEMDNSFEWLFPEVIREAIRLGLDKPSIYGGLITADIKVPRPSVTMPSINISDAAPRKIQEGETIPFGTVSFGQKEVKLVKMGRGIEITDEVRDYVPINVLSIYLQDVADFIKRTLDTMAIDILINGEQSDGSAAAAVIGVTTPGTLTYLDILRTWIRMGRMGRMPKGILTGEAIATEILELAEFKALAGNATLQNINIKTPVPSSQDLWIHGAFPTADQFMLVDTSRALVKLTSAALMTEQERIPSRQLGATYVTLTTGFCTLMRDSRLIVDKSLDIVANPFPAFFDIDNYENVPLQS